MAVGINKELFYDSQLSNTALTWSLEANKGEKIILTGLLDENDYAFRVSHSYTGYEAATGLAGTANFLNRGVDLLRSAQVVGSGINRGISQVKNNENIASNLPGLSEGLNKISSWIDTTKSNAENLVKQNTGMDLSSILRKSGSAKYFNALDFIKVFQGTSIDFTIPDLRVVLLSGLNVNGNEESVKSQVSKLNDVFIGNTGEFAGMFGMQQAPQDYLPTFNELGETIEFDGTFRLRLGDTTILKNLVLSDYSINLSKFRRLVPEGRDNGSDDYLYAEVSISLVPAAYVTKGMIDEYFQLSNTKRI